MILFFIIVKRNKIIVVFSVMSTIIIICIHKFYRFIKVIRSKLHQKKIIGQLKCIKKTLIKKNLE